tara:strand:- start:426 stop:1298 length:873 start_codon:yes stop_codon:yes gene_type:complete
LKDKDIRTFKKNLIYYFLFRLIRNFLTEDIILKIYNFKVFGSINKNKTSYFLLKKCEFGDFHELSTIKKFSEKNKIFFIDCGSNYGFYSLYVASLHSNNKIVSIEASKNTLFELDKNLHLNNFKNINYFNLAVSDTDEDNVSFNESEKDWESSLSHNEFNLYTTNKIKTVKIDTIIQNYELDKFKAIIKLDIEGNEMRAIKGSLNFIERSSPLIIIEFSKYIFNTRDNIEYLKFFLLKYDYSIYDINSKKQILENIIMKLNNLKKKHNTIGNFYLIKNSSETLREFLSNE